MIGFLRSLFGKTPNGPSEEQAVLIHMKLSNDEFGAPGETAKYYPLEDDLEAILANKGIGELDGHEFGGGYAVLFLYGSDADALYSLISERIRQLEALPGSYVVKRYGPPGSREERIELAV